MNNDQIILYLNKSSFLGFNTWLSYPCFSFLQPGKSLANYFIPAEKADADKDERANYLLENNIAQGICKLILSNIIEVDGLKQELNRIKEDSKSFDREFYNR